MAEAGNGKTGKNSQADLRPVNDSSKICPLKGNFTPVSDSLVSEPHAVPPILRFSQPVRV